MPLNLRLAAAILLAAAMLWSGVPAFGPGTSEAQNWRQDDPSAIVLPGTPGNQVRGQPGNSGGGTGLFRIFRFEPDRQTRPRSTPRPSASVGAPSSGGAGSSAPQTAAPVIALPPPKDPDARAVVTLGDEFADQMHEGMIDRLDGNRTLESFGHSVPGSGLTRVSDFDWRQEATRRLESYEAIAAVVVAIGYSDMRDLIDGEDRHAFGSAQWRQLYRNRLTALALTLSGQGYPVMFVGLPPLADPARNEQVRVVNQVLEEALAPTRARYVSVYEAFADEQGNFARSGPNLAGEVVSLRTREGIFFNRAGREKFAQFVERFIPQEGQEVPEPQVSSVIFEGSGLSDDGIGPVIMLTGGFADPEAALADDPQAALPEDEDVLQRLLRGAAATPPAGRADAFAAPAASGG